jgi:NAD(P)H-hydrate epimerase
MQLLVSAEVMQAFDRAAIRTIGIPGLILMENAGRAFADELARRVAPLAGRVIAVICGKGNNGGDGFVIARHLANRGCEVRVFLLARASGVQGDARVNLRSVMNMSTRAHANIRFKEVLSPRALDSAKGASVIVDAILGTGFTGEVRGLYAGAIDWINRQPAYVASVDIPSGVDATTGGVVRAAVSAQLTVTMGLAKTGLFLGPGADHCGELCVADISIPPSVMSPGDNPAFRVHAEDVSAALPERARDVHKYSAGKVLVIAGSRSFTGAPLLTARAAMRSGAGAVVLAAPASIHSALARRVEEVIIAPQEETPSGSLSTAALPQLLERGSWADAVAIGPGVSRDPATMELVRNFLAECRTTAVIDADALYAFQGHTALLSKRKGTSILTPHTGEFGGLTGTPFPESGGDRVSLSREAARRWRCIVILKGAPTVTADPAGPVFVNSTGNPGMATIGSGDVLTGLIAGLVAQGMPPVASAYGGAFLHGLAGDIGAERVGRRSLMAGDILTDISTALARING